MTIRAKWVDHLENKTMINNTSKALILENETGIIGRLQVSFLTNMKIRARVTGSSSEAQGVLLSRKRRFLN